MKSLFKGIPVVGLACLLACGGGSSSPDTEVITPPPPPPPPPPAFSFKVLQKNDCGEISPIQGVEFLIYDESPNSNPNTAFTTYQSDSNGLIELDVEANSKVSFTLNAIESNDNLISYSFTELNAGNYDMVVLFGSSAYTNDGCSCNPISVEAQLAGNQDIDNINSGSIYGGSNLFGGSYTTNNNAITFNQVQFCSNDFGDRPVIASVELMNIDDRVVYGVIEEPDFSMSIPAISLDQASLKQPKPDLGEPYLVDHGLIYDNQTYLFEYGSINDTNYTPYSDLSPDGYFFSIDMVGSASLNGSANDDIYFQRNRRAIQSSSDLSMLGNAPSGSTFNLNINTDDQLITWTTDSSFQADLALYHQRYRLENGLYLRRYIYAPNFNQVQIPRNTDEVNAMIESAQMQLTYLSLAAADDSNDFNEHVTSRRFLDDQGNSSYTLNQSDLFVYYFPPTTSANFNKLEDLSIRQSLEKDPNR